MSPDEDFSRDDFSANGMRRKPRDPAPRREPGGFFRGSEFPRLIFLLAVLAGGWALITGRRWGRGIGVFANLLLLGVAWYVFQSGQLQYAIVVALVAIVTLGLLFSPSTVEWISKRE